MTLSEFSAWALNQGTVCKTDGTFCGECVSLINQYLSKVHGINAGAWGHAKDWANTSNPIRQWFVPVNQSQAGDIGISGAVPGNPYGHIWIYQANTILEQNGRVARKVTISPDRNASVILRPKSGMPQAPQGGQDVINADQVKDLYRVFLGREASQGEANSWVGDWGRAFYQIKDSPEGKAYQVKLAAEKAAAEALKKQVAELSTRPTKAELQAALDATKDAQDKVAEATKALEEERAKKSEDTELIEEGKGFFTKLLKRWGLK